MTNKKFTKDDLCIFDLIDDLKQRGVIDMTIKKYVKCDKCNSEYDNYVTTYTGDDMNICDECYASMTYNGTGLVEICKECKKYLYYDDDKFHDEENNLICDECNHVMVSKKLVSEFISDYLYNIDME